MGGFFDKTNTYSVPYAFTTTVLGYNETQLQKAGVLDKANSWALILIRPWSPRSRARSPCWIRSAS